MKTKTYLHRAICALACAALVMLPAGCSLAKSGQADSADSADRLVGVYITPGPVEAQVEAVIHAEGEEKTVSFPDLTGWMLCHPQAKEADFLYHFTVGDLIDQKVHVDINEDDGIETHTLSASLYLLPRSDNVYINPVFQREDLSVYLLPGRVTGMGGDAVECGDLTTTLAQRVNRNGRTYSDSVAVTVAVKDAPAEITVAQFGRDDQLLNRQSYTPGQVPETLRAERSAAYLVVETRYADGQVERTLVNWAKSGLYSGFTTLCDNGNGALTALSTAVIWE